MPGFDRTGPWGEGPMTGGRRGFCTPSGRAYGPAGTWGYGRGRGYGRGYAPRFGRGRGYGRGFGPMGAPIWDDWYGPGYAGPYDMNPRDEAEMLKDEAKAMKRELDAIAKRIEELESQSQDTET